MPLLTSKGTYLRACLGQLQDEIFTPTYQILKVYTEALTGLSHIYLTDSLHTFSLKTVSLKMAPTVGMVGRLHIPRKGEGRGASDCPGPILRPAGGCVFSISSSNRESSWDLQLVTYVLELPFSPTSHPMKTHGNRLYSTYCFKAGISLEYILFCFWVN